MRQQLSLVNIICYWFIMLFSYTAVFKLADFSLYVYDLHRSPLLGPYAGFISIAVPLVEIIVTIALVFPASRFTGLWGAFALMVMFTIYVAVILTSKYKLPCTCGGIIRELTWRQHLYFNIVCTLLSVVGLWLLWKQKSIDHNQPEQ